MKNEFVRSDSVVREVGAVVLKQHRAEADLTRTPAVRARHEFDVLTMLRETMPDAYTVPRAIHLDEANGSLTMERATGTPLDLLLRESKRRGDAIAQLREPMRRAGAWLRAMQTATARRGHHGDYWPGNIFIDDARVTVIDFEGYREGFPLEDVAYFFIELELLLPRHARLIPALRGAFLEGYGAIDDAEALRVFTIQKAKHLLSRSPGHTFLHSLWQRYKLHSIVRRNTVR